MTEIVESGNLEWICTELIIYRCFVITVNWGSVDTIYRRQATHET